MSYSVLYNSMVAFHRAHFSMHFPFSEYFWKKQGKEFFQLKVSSVGNDQKFIRRILSSLDFYNYLKGTVFRILRINFFKESGINKPKTK